MDAAIRQLERVTLTSRAFHNDTFPVFCRDLAQLAGKDMVLAMNTGAEAVETAIKTARRWGYDVKGVAPDRAKIVVADGNFHGRTVTIVGFSDDPSARDGFGPFTPGFRSVPYGDADALRDAIDDETVAFLVEPIQGEAGVIVPPEGYPRRARELCTERGALTLNEGGTCQLALAVSVDGEPPGISERACHWKIEGQRFLLPRGAVTHKSSEFFIGEVTERFLKDASSKYDYVILDTAPVMAAALRIGKPKAPRTPAAVAWGSRGNCEPRSPVTSRCQMGPSLAHT